MTTYTIMHPVQKKPAIATQTHYWHDDGKTIGLKLSFPDGHHCAMTFAEIRSATQAAEDALAEMEPSHDAP